MRDALFAGLWAHLPSLILVAIFFIASLVLLDDTDESFSLEVGDFVVVILWQLAYFLVSVGFLGLVWLALTPGRGRSTREALRWFISRDWLEILLLRIPLALGITTSISYIHLAFKVNIPNFAPYTWDLFFAKVDNALFLGIDPWILSHQFMPDVLATSIFDTLYMIWFSIMQMSIFSVALLPPRHHLRLTFLFAFGLNWVIAGAILAILFPAVGPVYMERLIGDPMFQPLTDLLAQQGETTRIRALETQQWLWDGYTLADVAPVGISAFPSMHLAIAATCACLGFAVSRVAGLLASAFTLGILVASVHLGWHYAIDGIAGIALALVFWWVSARFTRWWLALTEPGGARETMVLEC
jgi:hypothetical protein